MTVADDKDTDASAKAEPETSEKPTLTSLLEDWEKGAPKKSQESSEQPDYDRVAMLEYKLEMKDIIPTVKGDVPVTDKFVETYINMRANEDARLDELWRNRGSNRAAWEKAIDSLGSEFKSFAEKSGIAKEKPVHKTDKSDDKGLAAAAHMARESTPAGAGFDAIDWSALSPVDFEVKKQQLFRAVKSGNVR